MKSKPLPAPHANTKADEEKAKRVCITLTPQDFETIARVGSVIGTPSLTRVLRHSLHLASEQLIPAKPKRTKK